MAKFSKKKSGELPAISTASLPDIVFMLLFFFMVATVMRDSTLMVQNTLPAADQIQKLDKKDRVIYIYAGKPSSRYRETYGTEARIQLNDKFATGVGLNFTYTDDRNYTATVFGGSVLGFYSPIREIQLSAEFEELHVNRKFEYDGIPDFRDEYWYPALHLGVGYNTGPVTIGVRYDVLYDDDKSIYGTPFMPFVRVYF